MFKVRPCFILFLTMTIACNSNQSGSSNASSGSADYIKGTFGYDLAFLHKYHNDLVILSDEKNEAQVIIAPSYQARVMTSTASGSMGRSFGWVNHELIASGKPAEHINAFGGEERIWLGPEGGQFSIFFKKGSAFTFDNWFVPKDMDTEPFRLITSSKTEARFEKDMHLENYSGTKFDLTVDRTIRLLGSSSIQQAIGMSLPASVQVVGFESDNGITNKGEHAWDKKTGMLSIWILSMMNAAEQTTIVIPYQQGDTSTMGKTVTDDYFGKVPSERLKTDKGLILFKADGNYRSKIGLSPYRALPVAGSYDALNGILTIAQFSLPEHEKNYVNSFWAIQENPFSGDAVNAYNDGPINGKQMGKFYELESSSPAAALAPGASIRHLHRTMHFKGNKESLNQISMKILGIGLEGITL